MAEDSGISVGTHRVVSHEQWLAARTAFLAKEKEFTRLRDELSRQRRELPWEAVTKDYVFEGANGKQTLSELFEGRSQLLIYHFMFDPDWDAGCPHCSHWADNFNSIIVHLNHRDVTMIAVSRASFETDFNYDYHVSFTADEMAQKKAFYNFAFKDPSVSERQGVSVFYKDASGRVFHTYSTYERGIDMMSVDYQYLDLVPKGRDEDGRGPFWVRRHDEYGR
jgi:predicted dithiol-disulfide oxidoreductase (DUF899 family)